MTGLTVTAVNSDCKRLIALDFSPRSKTFFQLLVLVHSVS